MPLLFHQYRCPFDEYRPVLALREIHWQWHLIINAGSFAPRNHLFRRPASCVHASRCWPRIRPHADLDVVGNVPIALLETCHAASIDSECPRPWWLLSNPAAVANGELRVATYFSAVSYSYQQKFWRLPNAAQAKERSPDPWYGVWSVNLIERSSWLDKILIASKGYGNWRIWWSLWWFWNGPAISADQLASCCNLLGGRWWWNQALTGPLMIPARKPEFASPKDIIGATIVALEGKNSLDEVTCSQG